MPGPFPGMNPYLENPLLWPDLHHSFITYARAALRVTLPPGYIAVVEERVYVVSSDAAYTEQRAGRNLVPDVFVRPRPDMPVSRQSRGVALAEIADLPRVVRVPSEGWERREGYIHIVDALDHGRVITAIEVLSPTNKSSTQPGHSVYLRKQQTLLESETHLLEIDLLRSGEHTVAAPLSALQGEEVVWDYLACLHRARQGAEYEVWPARIAERLPVARVPLEANLADVPLNLQVVLNRCYEEAGFEDRIDYRIPPVPPLRPEDEQWADALLRENGLR